MIVLTNKLDIYIGTNNKYRVHSAPSSLKEKPFFSNPCISHTSASLVDTPLFFLTFDFSVNQVWWWGGEMPLLMVFIVLMLCRQLLTFSMVT